MISAQIEHVGSITLFLELGRIIPVSGLMDLVQYKESLLYRFSKSCVPHIGCQNDIRDHLAQVEMIPESLITNAKKHMENLKDRTTVWSDFAAMTLVQQRTVL